MPTWDSHGIALLLLHRSSMEVPYVECLWNSPGGFYGIGWGLIIGNSMGWLYGQCIGIPWTCIGAGHWDFHGSALWVGHWDVHMGLPWNCIATAP